VALVGHSYGGAVISGASADNPQVAGLVLVAAYAPDEGETVLALGERFEPTDGAAAIRAADDGWLTLDTTMFPAVFAGDVDPAEAAVLAAVQKPTHGACFGSPAGPAGWHSLPTAYVRSVNDQMINPMLQSWFAERAGAAVTDLESSHASPVSHGAEVADVIAEVLG
jgi:pimeloyl-ACP methyl ester carboxylesterase